MNEIKKRLLGNEKNAIRDGSIWNFIYSMEYSLLSAVLMLIVTRIGGLQDAGIFMIAYTVTQMMSTIGNYGMRSFQVSDIKGKYSFSTYYTSRIISSIIMLIVCIGYSLLNHYDQQKMLLIIVLCIYRFIEVLEDVFHGEMQKKMRLDVSSKIASMRILGATLSFIIVYMVSKNLMLASMAFAIVALIVAFVLNVSVCNYFQEITLKVNCNDAIRLLWECFPICVGDFLYTYLVNAPKYAIDRNLSEEIQTIFNILFMPIFVINMLSSFIFKPLIVHMGILWNDGKRRELGQLILRQLLIIVIISIVAICGGVIIGLDILGWMYGVFLTEYKILFVMLIVFGGIAAIVSFFVVALTVVRKQIAIIIAYMIAMLVDVLLIDAVVSKFGIWGAGLMYGVSMSVVMFILGIVLLGTMIKGK